MEKGELIIEKYKICLEMTRYEGDLLWKIFGNFLLANTVFIAFIVSNLFNKPLFTYRLEIFIFGIIGFIFSILWMSTYLRNSKFYIFRMLQAREAEPDGRNIINGNGINFSKGSSVIVSDEKIKINWLGRIFRTKRSIPIFIFLFVAIYISSILCGPWN